MLKAAIEKIESLTAVEIIKAGAREFLSRGCSEVVPCRIDSIEVHTLQAVVDFFKNDKSDVTIETAMIHIVDPYTVRVVDVLADEVYREREHFMTAKRIHGEFMFGHYFDQEEMIISLLTMFEKSAVLDDVMKVVSGLVVSSDVEVKDNGVSQDVQVRKGIGRVESVTIENPIMLKPIRTFAEVAQVESPHVLRVRERGGVPEIAIFEAGGGQWKNEAISNIKAWLVDGLGDVKILG